MGSEGYVVGGRYRLHSVLGTGGMGVVWRAFDQRLSRWVAVKEIRFNQPMTSQEREEVKQRAMFEALSAGRLVHPNVVAIYDTVDDDNRPWVVMRLVEGRSLRDTISQDGPLDPQTAARLGLGLLNALDAAHAAGIVHRDVKPSNVLMLPDGRPLLSDFSIATVVGDRVPIRGGAVMGSPGYVAPERLHGREGGTASDLFGLGATLFYAVEGIGPFARNDALACLIATVCEPHPRPLRAGPLTAVIDGLLAKDEDDRLDSAGVRVGLANAARPRPRGVYRVPMNSRRAYMPYRAVATPPWPVAAPTIATESNSRGPSRRRVAIVTASAALLVPLAAAVASIGGGSGPGIGRADAAIQQPAPPGTGSATAPPGARRALRPDVVSTTFSTAPDDADRPIGGLATDPVAGTTPTGGTSTAPSGGGGGGQTGTTEATPPAAEVTGLSVNVSVDETACTYSASATVTVSAATTVTYRVTWTDGSSGTSSTEFTAAGSGALAVPSNVAHAAGPVWVQVEVVSPTALTQRAGATLPDSCDPTAPTTPPSSPDPTPTSAAPTDQQPPADSAETPTPTP
ncbi:serine/threonine-protein kinase [Phytohabitans rumicis]|uniref:serine/threonine-protein kinase n=1 Tax=Phytohabitans rumicis TaxID=1076125 RepID=UPI0031E65CA5